MVYTESLMHLPRPNFRLRTLLLLVAVLGLLTAWPGKWAYERLLRRMTVSDIREHGGSLHYGEGGYAVDFGNADPGSLRLLSDASAVVLAGTAASDADLEPLRDFKLLISLNLTGCPVTDDGIKKLKGLVNLKYLFLGDTNVSDEGLKHLSGLSGLEVLVLDNTRIGDSGLLSLERLSRLRELSLWGTRVSVSGAFRLKNLSALKSVSMPRSETPASDSRELQKMLPGASVYRQPTMIPR
jgi:Leucine Rich repeat